MNNIDFSGEKSGKARDIREHPESHAAGDEDGEDEQVFPLARIDTEEYQQSQPRPGQKPCQHGPRRDDTVHPELRQGDRGGTVGDQTEECGDRVADAGERGHDGAEAFCPDEKDQRIDGEGHEEKKDGDMQRMVQGGTQNTALTVTAILVAQFVDVQIAVFFAAPAEEKVEEKTDQNADRRFPADQQEDGLPAHAAGEQKREHLVRGGEKNGDQRPCGQKMPGVQIGCRDGKAALRNCAEQSSEEGTEPADTQEQMLRFRRGAVFDEFHNKIGQKEEGKQLRRVDETVEENFVKKSGHNS